GSCKLNCPPPCIPQNKSIILDSPRPAFAGCGRCFAFGYGRTGGNPKLTSFQRNPAPDSACFSARGTAVIFKFAEPGFHSASSAASHPMFRGRGPVCFLLWLKAPRRHRRRSGGGGRASQDLVLPWATARERDGRRYTRAA